MRGAGKTCLAVTVLAAAALATLASARADVTVGSGLGRSPARDTCSEPSCTVANLGAANDGTATSPIDGVVVRWRVRARASDAEARLNVIRPAGVGSFTSVNESQARSIDVDDTTTITFPARQRIRTGDHIGLRAEGVLLATATMVDPAEYAEWTPPLGNLPESPDTEVTGSELLVNADVEPDTDGDGFGDETQDVCPGAAGSRNGCETTPPETTITKAPKRKIKTRKRKKRVRFEFVASEPGSEFRCVVDDEPPVACDSPFKEKFRRGMHRFEVEAIDAADNADPTPAVATFKLKRQS